MSKACPRPRELTRLLDGEATENRAAELRAHVGSCRACAAELDAQRALVTRISAPLPGTPPEHAVDAVMRRIDSTGTPARSAEPRPRVWAVGGLVAAFSAALAITVLVRPDARDGGEFRARGADVDWPRKVGVEVWALEAGPRKIAPGDRLRAGVPLVGSFSNVDSAPAYLLAYALDARGEVHWLYPAFLDPRADPESIPLDASVVHRALPDSVVLQDVAPGALRIVLVVTRTPLRVSSIESVPGAERTPEALRARWPDARVDELPLVFGSPSADREVQP